MIMLNNVIKTDNIIDTKRNDVYNIFFSELYAYLILFSSVAIMTIYFLLERHQIQVYHCNKQDLNISIDSFALSFIAFMLIQGLFSN